MKKILFVTTNDSIEWGGSEELWYATALEFLKHDYDVGIGIRDRNPLPQKIAAIQFEGKVHLFLKKAPAYSFPERAFNRFVPGKYRVIKPQDYLKDMIEWHPDLAVISQGNNMDGLDMMEFFRSHRIPYINIVQAVYEGIWPDTGKAKRMEDGYKASIANYFVSESNHKLTVLQTGAAIPRARIIRNPFNVPYENDLSFPQSDFYKLACVARLEFYAKGQDVLLQVMSDAKWKSRNIRVNFFGKGINEQGTKNLIRHFGLGNVFVAGHASPIDIWKTHHGLILPSRFEGLPLALVEAMLCSRFGIVTDIGGNSEVIIDNVNGFLAAAPQPQYLDEALERAWQRREEWDLLGANAGTHIRTLVPSSPSYDFYTLISKLIIDLQ